MGTGVAQHFLPQVAGDFLEPAIPKHDISQPIEGKYEYWHRLDDFTVPALGIFEFTTKVFMFAVPTSLNQSPARRRTPRARMKSTIA